MSREVSGVARGVVAALMVALAPVAYAQDSDPAAVRAQGAAMVFGSDGVTQDVAGGVRLLEQAAAADDVEAKATLGKVLLDGYYVPSEPARAIGLLEDAAAAGDVRAQRTLGVALLWGGEAFAADPARARGLLEQAAAQGDTEAMRVLGQQLVGGWVLPQDSVAGRARLEEAIAAGDVRAGSILGGFLLYGDALPADPSRALALFEVAAEAGDGEGLERYGEWLMWRQDDPAAAEALLRRAGTLGRGRAWTVLAEGAMHGYLPPGSRAKFDEFAEKARAAGEERIVLLEAQRRMWGITLRASGPETIALLEEAADAGNAMAAKYLVSLVRDGNEYNVRKRPEAARAYIETYGALLTPLEAEQLAFTIDAAGMAGTRAFSEVAATLDSRPELMSAWFAKELFKANPNLAVYLLQARMSARGEYAGPVNGLATRATLTAIGRLCRAETGNTECADRPLSADVIGPLLAR